MTQKKDESGGSSSVNRKPFPLWCKFTQVNWGELNLFVFWPFFPHQSKIKFFPQYQWSFGRFFCFSTLFLCAVFRCQSKVYSTISQYFQLVEWYFIPSFFLTVQYFVQGHKLFSSSFTQSFPHLHFFRLLLTTENCKFQWAFRLITWSIVRLFHFFHFFTFKFPLSFPLKCFLSFRPFQPFLWFFLCWVISVHLSVFIVFKGQVQFFCGELVSCGLIYCPR